MLNEREWLKISEAAIKRLGLSADSPRKWKDGGYIPALRAKQLADATGIAVNRILSMARQPKRGAA